MHISTAGNHRHDSRYAQFCAFLDRPFHAVEFEDGKQESDVGCGCGSHFFAQFELDSALVDAL